ncbi:MAG: pyrroloquinoline quinone-dependent dehydrogenase [Proteobacteria bacterium]|nr:pyrroloquinoline quinone-dependent dehydrogenase [Pseudomonadota bacterium]
MALILNPLTVAAAEDGWIYYGGDQGGRHYSANRQINTDNVTDLEVAWMSRSGDVETYAEAMVNTSGQTTPILLPREAGESLVYCTPFNRVIALDPATGKQRWSADPQIDRSGDRSLRCRGISYAEEKSVAVGSACRYRIFSATQDRRLIALDALDGKACKGFGINGEVKLEPSAAYKTGVVSSSAAPVVANGVIVLGSTIVDFVKSKSPRGTVKAFSSLDGKLLWEFDPLLGNKDSGSANVWSQMSVDEENKLIYLPTSAPSPDYYGKARPGNNLYANSIVALDLNSGAVRWYFQHVRHDLWDYDSPAQPILFEWNKDGKRIPALALLTKQSLIFVFNRLTGEPLWEITERPAPPSLIPGEKPSASQPWPIAPPPLIDAFLMPDQAWGIASFEKMACADQISKLHNLGLFTPLSETLTLMYPGSLGGANWGGGALLGNSGKLLVNINNLAFTGKLIRTPESPAGNDTKVDHPGAGKRMQVTMQGTPYTVDIGALQSPFGIPCNPPPWGKLVSVDLINGKIDWEVALGSIHEMGPLKLPFQVNWGTPNLGGGIATAGGLFFIGATMDRQFRAFDTATGEQLWRYQLPVDATATPMTYSYKGRQYVVINSGGHYMFKRGYGDYLYAFALPQ